MSMKAHINPPKKVSPKSARRPKKVPPRTVPLIFLVLMMGCSGPQKETEMNDEQFDTYIDQSYEWFEQRQAKLQKEYAIGSFESYWLDQELGILQFKNGNVVELEFPYIGIGSWNNEKKSYMWSWANQSVLRERQLESLPIRALGKKTGMSIFDEESFNCDEDMAWEIAAMGARELDALGVYRVPHGNLEIFLAIMPPNNAMNRTP